MLSILFIHIYYSHNLSLSQKQALRWCIIWEMKDIGPLLRIRIPNISKVSIIRYNDITTNKENSTSKA